MKIHDSGDGFEVTVAEASQALINGKKPQKGDTISVHYTGTFEDGRVFDSSRERNKPFAFQIGTNQVIKCWEEGFLHLAKSQRGSFRCPPEYAYGSAGAGSIIPPNSVLIFNVELLDINPTAQGDAGQQMSAGSD